MYKSQLLNMITFYNHNIQRLKQKPIPEKQTNLHVQYLMITALITFFNFHQVFQSFL